MELLFLMGLIGLGFALKAYDMWLDREAKRLAERNRAAQMELDKRWHQ
jgi:hypothetical protein